MPSAKSSSADAAKKGKKLSSLSALQSTLRFSSLPIKDAPIKVANSSSHAHDMPPPPTGITGKGQRPASSSHDRSAPQSGSFSRRAGEHPKGRGVDVEGAHLEQYYHNGLHRGGMWADDYAPISETDLAPGKQRLNKVKEWIHEALYGHPAGYVAPPGGVTDTQRDKLRRYRRILLVTGPAGIGKTTSIRVIAKQMGVELVEWGEGVEEWSLGGKIERESPIAKVTTFLSRQSYVPLTMAGTSQPASLSRPRMLFMTALPNLSHPPTRDAFHSALSSFCKHYSTASSPLVIVHSDDGSSGRAEESWMDRDGGGTNGSLHVVGRDVISSPYCTEIGFLPLAPTFMFKALTRVLNIAQYDPTLRPPASAVQLIGMNSNGDLRSAINSLQVLCTRRLTSEGPKRKGPDIGGSPRKKGKGSRGGKGSKIDVSDDLRAVLKTVTRRERSLGLFHALGKILYNKRLGDPDVGNEDEELLAAIRALPQENPLPRHLKEHQRTRSLIQIDAFLPTIPVDASTFALWVHQNLPSFCSDVEEASTAVDSFCDGDLMKTDADIWQSSPVAIAYALHLIVRSALHGLPSPVAKASHKLAKPQFFGALHSEKTNAGYLDVAAAYLGSKAVKNSSRLSEVALGTESEQAWGGLPSKRTLATELVPMLTKMQGMTHDPLLPASLRPLIMPAFTAGTAEVHEFGAADVFGTEWDYGEGLHEAPGSMPPLSGMTGGWDRCEGDSDVAEAELEEEIEVWD